MSDYRNNHYVPRAYQRAFLRNDAKERKFYYLDLHPEKVVSPGGRAHVRAELMRWGPPRCFAQRDLYTTQLGSWLSTAIERRFFGNADQHGPEGVRFFAEYEHLRVNNPLFNVFIRYMSLQKLRTPKGLMQLAGVVNTKDKVSTLAAMQQMRDIFCAIWAEGIWCILDASTSPTKFILSDHPVTVYNKGCFPGSKHCRAHRDPDIRLTGTHTIIPLSFDKVLVITNQSWLRDPYANPLAMRPNPEFFRSAVFKYTEIQTGRQLTETEVCEVNHVIKERALRYVAAAEREWLYPEDGVPTQIWDRLGRGHLFMPDPRSMTMGGDIWMTFDDGSTAAYDAYGRRPGQPGYGGAREVEREWIAHLAYQGEYARLFGPRRRGRTYDHARNQPEEDPPDFHSYHLRLEGKYKALLREMGKRR